MSKMEKSGIFNLFCIFFGKFNYLKSQQDKHDDSIENERKDIVVGM